MLKEIRLSESKVYVYIQLSESPDKVPPTLSLANQSCKRCCSSGTRPWSLDLFLAWRYSLPQIKFQAK